MKTNIKKWLAVAAVAVLTATCMTIDEVIHPEGAQPNSEITIQVKLKFKAETERTSKLAFGILAPKSWNIGANGKLSLTTTYADLPVNLVTDNPLTLIPANRLNPSTGTPWAASFQSRFGLQDNFGPMEWVVFESGHVFTADGSNGGANATIDGTVTVKVTTGPENLRVNMAYTYCGEAFGFSASGEEYPDNDVIASKVLEIGDQDNDLVDYTVPPAISTTPSVFGFGDIFAINFREQNSALKGTDAVYMQAKVIYDGGKEKTVYGVSEQTLMEHLGDDLWQRYIYPLDYFGLPAGTTIERIEVYLTDKTQTAEVKDNTGMDFQILEDAE